MMDDDCRIGADGNSTCVSVTDSTWPLYVLLVLAAVWLFIKWQERRLK
jgi:hypothetical protein